MTVERVLLQSGLDEVLLRIFRKKNNMVLPVCSLKITILSNIHIAVSLNVTVPSCGSTHTMMGVVSAQDPTPNNDTNKVIVTFENMLDVSITINYIAPDGTVDSNTVIPFSYFYVSNSVFSADYLMLMVLPFVLHHSL